MLDVVVNSGRDSVSPVVGTGVWSASGHRTSSVCVETMAALFNKPTVEQDKKKHEAKRNAFFTFAALALNSNQAINHHQIHLSLQCNSQSIVNTPSFKHRLKCYITAYSLVCKLATFMTYISSFIRQAGFVLALGCYLPSPVCLCIKFT